MTRTRILIEDEPAIALDIEKSLVTLRDEVIAVSDCAEVALLAIPPQPNFVLTDILGANCSGKRAWSRSTFIASIHKRPVEQ